jgi:CheY-like chemotaxis protein
MTLSGTDVLLVGHSFHSAQALADWLRRRGFRCHFARNMREASALLRSRSVGLVLSNTRLPDGSGFGLLTSLAGLPVSAFPLLAGREYLLLAARYRRRAGMFGIASSPPSGVCKRPPRNSAPFTCRDIGQLAGSQGRRLIRNLHGECDPPERCLCLFERGKRNLF